MRRSGTTSQSRSPPERQVHPTRGPAMESVEVNARHKPGSLDSPIQVVDEYEQHVEVLARAEGLRPHLRLKSPTLGDRPVGHPCFHLHGKRGRAVAEVEH